MTLALYPLAAAAGAVAGALLHEAAHAIVAAAFGVLNGFGWQGGLAGGPYVDFAPETRIQSEAVRKAPLALGVVALVLLVTGYDGPTLRWVAAAGATIALLWSSPEDLFLDSARQA